MILIASQILIGLVAGLISTTGMSLTEYPIWRRWGMEGVSEWHLNQVMAGRIVHRSPRSVVPHGLILHFLHGGLAGIVFIFLIPSFPNIPIIIVGVGFGIVLWVIAVMITKPVTGVGFRRHPLRLLPIVVSLGGHILYGLLLGLAVIYI
jgi:hypothetical protein